MRLRLLACVLLFCAVGCGDNVAPVSGKVTLDNKPLPNATVLFEPKTGPGSHGKTNDQGEFTLSLMTKDVKGASPGEHTVRITAYDGEMPKAADSNPKMPKQLVPEEYNVRSKLTFEVPSGGTTAANFDLKSKGG